MVYRTLTLSGVASILAGATHYTAHHIAGKDQYFDQAGVQEAGLAVVGLTFVGATILQWV